MSNQSISHILAQDGQYQSQLAALMKQQAGLVICENVKAALVAAALRRYHTRERQARASFNSIGQKYFAISLNNPSR